MYRKFSFILFIIFTSSAKAQQIGLQQCIDTAIANNITIKQKYLLMQSQK